jgi:hypothetical protein
MTGWAVSTLLIVGQVARRAARNGGGYQALAAG